MTIHRLKQTGLQVAILSVIVLGVNRALMADNVGGMFGVSGIIGAAFPTGPTEVTSVTDSSGLNLGGMLSLQMGSMIGVGISFEHMDLGPGKQASPINLMLLLRMMPESRWNPTFQIGCGSVGSLDTNRKQTMGFKTGIGLDYFVTPTLAAGPQVNYYYLSHSGGTANTRADIVSVNAVVSYFFGNMNGTGGK